MRYTNSLYMFGKMLLNDNILYNSQFGLLGFKADNNSNQECIKSNRAAVSYGAIKYRLYTTLELCFPGGISSAQFSLEFVARIPFGAISFIMDLAGDAIFQDLSVVLRFCGKCEYE